MSDVHVRTLTGEDLVLEHAVVEAFKTRLRGFYCAPANPAMTRRGVSGTA